MRNKIIQGDLEYITNQDLNWAIFKNCTILISGASGFLPSYMVETFMYLNETKNLNIKVIGLVRNLKNALIKFSHCNKKYLTIIQHNVNNKIIIQENVDYIIHAASQATPKVFKDDPVGTILPNTIGTYNLLTLANEKKVKGFLYFSTTGVYGHNCILKYPLKENTFGKVNPMELSSCYIESKRMGENMCIAWMHQYGVPIKVIRPSITYGYGINLDDGRSFADFIKNILNKEDIVLYSKGDVMRNFCYVADAVLGFFIVLIKGKVGEAYNVATDIEISVVGLAHLLVEKIFPELSLKVVHKSNETKNYLRKDFPRTATNIDKIKSLGWRLNFSLEDGFKRTIKSFTDNKEGIK